MKRYKKRKDAATGERVQEISGRESTGKGGGISRIQETGVSLAKLTVKGERAKEKRALPKKRECQRQR